MRNLTPRQGWGKEERPGKASSWRVKLGISEDVQPRHATRWLPNPTLEQSGWLRQRKLDFTPPASLLHPPLSCVKNLKRIRVLINWILISMTNLLNKGILHNWRLSSFGGLHQLCSSGQAPWKCSGHRNWPRGKMFRACCWTQPDKLQATLFPSFSLSLSQTLCP